MKPIFGFSVISKQELLRAFSGRKLTRRASYGQCLLQGPGSMDPPVISVCNSFLMNEQIPCVESGGPVPLPLGSGFAVMNGQLPVGSTAWLCRWAGAEGMRTRIHTLAAALTRAFFVA